VAQSGTTAAPDLRGIPRSCPGIVLAAFLNMFRCVRAKAQSYCLCLLIGPVACSERLAQSINHMSDAHPSKPGEDTQPSTRSSDSQQPDGADAALIADDSGTADAAPLADAAPVVPLLQPGVVLGPTSSIALSFFGHASYLPAQPGCGGEYEATISVDKQTVRAIGITFQESIDIDTEFPLLPCENCGTHVMNYLVGDELKIQVNSNGIEVPDVADKVSMGTIRFQSLTGNLAFDFSFTFSDGKLLQGTFNLPIERDLACPGPQH